MERNKIIILGATGNVGSYLTLYANDFFDKNKFEIIASGRRDTKVFDSYGIKYIPVDITNPEDFNKLPQDKVHAVMCLAAQIPSYMDNYDGRKYLDSIVMGGYNVLEYCRIVKADRILYTQTVFDVSEYPSGYIIKPDSPRNFSFKGDHAMYVIAKNCMLDMIEHYYQEYGLKNFIFRLPTIYGYSPYQFYFPNGVKTLRPLYAQINRAMKGEPLTIWGDPEYAKDMVHVYDFSQLLCKAALVNRNKGFYNVGTGIPVSLRDQCQAIIDVFSPKDNISPIKFVEKEGNYKTGGGFLMDITNAKEELGYKPVYDVHKLFEDYKKEMVLNRFIELRGK